MTATSVAGTAPGAGPAAAPGRTRLWMRAVRDGFIALLPLTIAGVAANVVATLLTLVSGGPAALALRTFGSNLAAATMGATLQIMGLAAAMAIAYRLCALLEQRDQDSRESLISVAPIAAAAFLVLTPVNDAQGLLSFGYASALRGIFVGILVAELLAMFRRRWPRAASLEFIGPNAMVRYAIRLGSMAALVLFIVFTFRVAGLEALSRAGALLESWPAFALPPGGLDRWSASTALVLANQLLWLLGVNGGQVLHELAASGTVPLLSAALGSGPQGSPTVAFLNTFAHLGGAGATWGLIVACLLWCKDTGLRRIAWLSVLPAAFNINEILIFGLPIVFSRMLLVPFVAAPLLNALLAIVATAWLPIASHPFAPAWFTPVFLSGWLWSGGWAGAALQALLLMASTAMYRPFILRLEQIKLHQSRTNIDQVIRHLSDAVQASTPKVLAREDSIGDVARLLVLDVQADLGTDRLRLVYQPQHDLDGRVIGFEALLRWKHRQLGPIPTGAIINISEECEAIHRIGEWVLDQACRDLLAWTRRGLGGITLSINMSPVQLENAEWAPLVAAVIASHGIDPATIDIELTEGRMMSSTLQSQTTLAQLHASGVKLSMDDFGMGYTSLLYMQRFEIHTIKLDGQLTRDVERNVVSQQIIEAVSHLGRSRGVKVVAEFVETASQRDRLAALGCDYFQGWLYSPAIDADAVPGYVAQAAERSAPALTRRPMPAEPHPAG